MSEKTDERTSDAVAAAPPPHKRLRLNKPPRLPPLPIGADGPLAAVDESSALNLSRCHVCGVDPSPLPLETLDSLWRLLLLCPRCVVSFHSSALCSYCFHSLSADSVKDGTENVGDDDDFACVTCGRTVHGRCLAVRPPSRDAFVCVDCWVPPAFSNMTSRDWRVSVFGDGSSSLEKVVRSVSASAKKAEMAAAKARNLADRKSLMAKRAAELAQSALDCAAARVGRAKARGRGGWGSILGNGSVLEDKEVALHLHRVINCSPRFYSRRQRGSSDSKVLVPPEIEKQDSLNSRLGSSLDSSASEHGCADESDYCASQNDGHDETGRYGKTYRRKNFLAKLVDSPNVMPVMEGLTYMRRKYKQEQYLLDLFLNSK